MSAPWIGVDFDGTLATYDGYKGPVVLGEPVPAMVERVKRWLAEGREVRIFTARAYPIGYVHPDPKSFIALVNNCESYDEFIEKNRPRLQEAADAVEAIQAWCVQHIGQALPITCVKDYSMEELWDDRAVQVRANTGEPVGESTRGLT